MKTIRRSLLVLGLLLLPAAASAQVHDTAALPASLREARTALMNAYSELAPANVLKHYADDVTVQFGTDLFRGLDAASMWLHDALAGLVAVRFSPPSFTVADDEVRETARYGILLPNGDESGGTYEAVWRQDGGVWKVKRMTIQ